MQTMIGNVNMVVIAATVAAQFAFLWSVTTITSAGTQLNTFNCSVKYRTRTFMLHSTRHLSWTDAAYTCNKSHTNGALTSNFGSHIQKCLEKNLNASARSPANYWIGAQLDLMGNLTWVNINEGRQRAKIPAGANWSSQPVADGCVLLNGSANWQWSVANCSETNLFICEHSELIISTTTTREWAVEVTTTKATDSEVHDTTSGEKRHQSTQSQPPPLTTTITKTSATTIRTTRPTASSYPATVATPRTKEIITASTIETEVSSNTGTSALFTQLWTDMVATPSTGSTPESETGFGAVMYAVIALSCLLCFLVAVIVVIIVIYFRQFRAKQQNAESDSSSLRDTNHGNSTHPPTVNSRRHSDQKQPVVSPRRNVGGAASSSSTPGIAQTNLSVSGPLLQPDITVAASAVVSVNGTQYQLDKNDLIGIYAQILPSSGPLQDRQPDGPVIYASL